MSSESERSSQNTENPTRVFSARNTDAETAMPLAGNNPGSRRVGPYKLLQLIGEGGMGSVWMAEQQEPVKRRVALKLIKTGTASKEVIARFEAERQALAMMDHQNIAKVLGGGTDDDGAPFFVMELVKGTPLTNYCDDNRLSIERRLELFVSVCHAIQHAHQKGIIHRDLKPSNVLVTLYDGKPVAKVIDFGLAKALDHTHRLTDKTMFTEFGKIVGTVQYMSPEQAETNGLDVDTRTDVYSLGVMLYELLTGTTPLDKETVGSNALLQVLEIIREKEPARPSSRLSSSGDALSGISDYRQIAPHKLKQILRGELDWIVMKALEKDRTRRYQTANDLADDITNYLTGDPVEARPPSASYKISKFIRKNKGLVAAATTILLLLLAGIAGTTAGFFQANKERNAAVAAKEKADLKTAEAERERDRANAEWERAQQQSKRADKAEQEMEKSAKKTRDMLALVNAAFQYSPSQLTRGMFTDDSETENWRTVFNDMSKLVQFSEVPNTENVGFEDAIWKKVAKPQLTYSELLTLRAIAKQTPNPRSRKTLAVAEYRLGNFQQAIATAERAIQSSSKGETTPLEFYAVLSMSHHRLGNPELANQNRRQMKKLLDAPQYKDNSAARELALEVDTLFALSASEDQWDE